MRGSAVSFEMDFDTAEAIGLDGTGMDMDPRFPHTYFTLTDEEKVKFWQYRITGTPELKSMADVSDFADGLVSAARGLDELVREWHALDLPGDFVVPELGLPVSMSVDEAAMEIFVLSEHIRNAGENVFAYVGQRRRG